VPAGFSSNSSRCRRNVFRSTRVLQEAMLTHDVEMDFSSTAASFKAAEAELKLLAVVFRLSVGIYTDTHSG
jgi:hypothetical protein